MAGLTGRTYHSSLWLTVDNRKLVQALECSVPHITMYMFFYSALAALGSCFDVSGHESIVKPTLFPSHHQECLVSKMQTISKDDLDNGLALANPTGWHEITLLLYDLS